MNPFRRFHKCCGIGEMTRGMALKIWVLYLWEALRRHQKGLSTRNGAQSLQDASRVLQINCETGAVDKDDLKFSMLSRVADLGDLPTFVAVAWRFTREVLRPKIIERGVISPPAR
jgi:hypothetical protein